MKSKLCNLVLGGIVFLSIASLALCQEEAAITPPQDSPGFEEVSWLWGEVKAVDPAQATLTINYMDYQTDEEKELILATNQQTKFENVNDFGEIKVGDTTSIDYVVRDDRNIAQNISVEKIGGTPEAVKPEDVVERPAPDTE